MTEILLAIKFCGFRSISEISEISNKKIEHKINLMDVKYIQNALIMLYLNGRYYFAIMSAILAV